MQLFTDEAKDCGRRVTIAWNSTGNIPQGTVFSVTSSPWRLSSAAQKYFARETVIGVCRRDGQRPVGGQLSSLDLMIWNQKATEL